jgi:DNA-binding CsgD family transcriptional regulator
VAEEGLALAEETGDEHVSQQCRTWLSFALIMQGDLATARALLSDLVAEAEAGRAPIWRMYGLAVLGQTLAFLGNADEARAAAQASIAIAEDLGVPLYEVAGYVGLSLAAKAAGDVSTLRGASHAGWQRVRSRVELQPVHVIDMAEADLAMGDLVTASRRVDEAVGTTTSLGIKYQLMQALLTRARVAVAQGDMRRAEDDADQALLEGYRIESKTGIVDAFECLAGSTDNADEHPRAARLMGAADAIRRCIGYMRFQLYQAGYDRTVMTLRTSMGDAAFEQAWAEGAGLSVDEAFSYALRGRGERKRPTTGWASLTPAEADVARLVRDGLTNKDIATRLFVSPRTVQSHLTHIYTKLGVSSRVQLAQEASRRG